jgi:hypothetical protein
MKENLTSALFLLQKYAITKSFENQMQAWKLQEAVQLFILNGKTL